MGYITSALRDAHVMLPQIPFPPGGKLNMTVMLTYKTVSKIIGT
jgi:hypothetical protein